MVAVSSVPLLHLACGLPLDLFCRGHFWDGRVIGPRRADIGLVVPCQLFLPRGDPLRLLAFIVRLVLHGFCRVRLIDLFQLLPGGWSIFSR
jgi:hypothetical protein